MTVSTDEMTGVQALERKHSDLPMQPGRVLRREFEYKRHGTLSFIVNFEVASGRVGTVSAGPTRNEADFLAHIRRTVESDPRIVQWHFILDNLNTHQSEALFVMWPTNPIWTSTWASKVSRAFWRRCQPALLFSAIRPIASFFTTLPNTLPG